MSRYLLTLLLMITLTTPAFSEDELTGSGFELGAVATDALGWRSLVDSVVGDDGAFASDLPVVGQNQSEEVIEIRGGGFGNLKGDTEGAEAVLIQNKVAEDAVEAKVQDTPLCYPNPFSQNGTTYLQYTLNKAADITIEVYDMFANKILTQDYSKNTQGGLKDRNVVKIQAIDGNILSVGVYFIFIVHDNKVLSRAKVAVIP